LLQSDKDQNCGDLLPDRLDFEIDVHRDGEVVPPPSKVSPEQHQESPTETPQNNEHEVNIDASSISIDPSLNGAHESDFPSVGDTAVPLKGDSEGANRIGLPHRSTALTLLTAGCHQQSYLKGEKGANFVSQRLKKSANGGPCCRKANTCQRGRKTNKIKSRVHCLQ
jgi:hypothetical protein